MNMLSLYCGHLLVLVMSFRPAERMHVLNFYRNMWTDLYASHSDPSCVTVIFWYWSISSGNAVTKQSVYFSELCIIYFCCSQRSRGVFHFIIISVRFVKNSWRWCVEEQWHSQALKSWWAEGAWEMKVPQWGPGAEPQWASGGGYIQTFCSYQMLFYAGLLPSPSFISLYHLPKNLFWSARIPWPGTAGAGWTRAVLWLHYWCRMRHHVMLCNQWLQCDHQ